MQTHWISGRAVSAPPGCEAIEVLNPATEAVVDRIPAGDASSADAAARAARAAFGPWSSLAPTERKLALDVAADKLAGAAEELGRLLTLELGRPLAQSIAEVRGAATAMRELAVLALHVGARSQMSAATHLNFQQRVPRGVCAVIVPWNYPIMAGVENVAASLAAGNAVVWKPSEKTPLSSRLLAERAFDALPPGLVNVLLGNGAGAGEPLATHPEVDVVVFVGSERTGQRLGALCATRSKKAILELGGKDALIVDETVDIQAAARLAAEAAFANVGQICTSTERIYVHRKRFEPFVDALVAESARRRVGDGLDPATDIGPLVDRLQLSHVSSQVDEAVRLGGNLHFGGARLDRRGWFFPPTVLTGMPEDCSLMVEETFGPVAPCVPFDDFDEALAKANASRFGLAAILCTRDSGRAIHATHSLKAGMVRINTLRGRSAGGTSEPAGSSGIGHGWGIEFLHELTRQKSVFWRGEPT